MQKPLKVFGIGFNRTGTTSLKRALRQLGYRTLDKNGPFVKHYKNGKIDQILDGLSAWDGYQDWPWPFLYKELLTRFDADARFVLTRRATPEKWVESLKKHSLRTKPDQNQRRTMLGYDYPHGLEAEHIKIYQDHYSQVKAHFQAAGKSHLLAEMCWEEGDGWPELCALLGDPVPPGNFPHANASGEAQPKPEIVAENRRRVETQLQNLAAS